MCLVLFARNYHPKFPIIILSNRDEYFSRDSAPAAFWQEDQNVFAGRDLIAMGSWLGVTREGKYALVTNIRNPKQHKLGLTSRGNLVKDYLLTASSPVNYVNELSKFDNTYNGYNLIVGNLQQSMFYTNNSCTRKSILLQDGVYGLSNASLDTGWPKVVKSKILFGKINPALYEAADPTELVAMMFELLADKTLADENLLPDTGMEKEVELLLSSIFVSIPNFHYGTCSSSVILFTADQHILFYERTFREDLSHSTSFTKIVLNN